MRRVFFLVWGAAMIAAPAAAQVTTLDEGSFTIYVGGERAGHEQFTIQRQLERGVMTVLAYANIQVGERRVVPALIADTSGVPASYKLDESVDGTTVRRLDAVAIGTIFTLRSVTPRGRSERDLRLTRGTLLLDEDIAHQYFFLARGATERARVIVARHLLHDSVTVTFVDAREVEIGNGTVPSRHLRVTNQAGVATDVWVDAAGRVLRVATPSRGFVAIRDDPPR